MSREKGALATACAMLAAVFMMAMSSQPMRQAYDHKARNELSAVETRVKAIELHTRPIDAECFNDIDRALRRGHAREPSSLP